MHRRGWHRRDWHRRDWRRRQPPFVDIASLPGRRASRDFTGFFDESAVSQAQQPFDAASEFACGYVAPRWGNCTRFHLTGRRSSLGKTDAADRDSMLQIAGGQRART